MTEVVEYLKWVSDGFLPSMDEARLNKFIEWCEPRHVLARFDGECQITSHSVFGFKYEFSQSMATYEAAVLSYEIFEIARLFSAVSFPVILLKGGAYSALSMRVARGRRVSDLDILVPRKDLQETENILHENGWGWLAKNKNAYDQAYYRNLMHELPPLVHNKRHTIIDVHHALSPLTSPVQVPTDMLIKELQQVGTTGLFALSNVDIFLHSALHSFYASDFQTPVRSLIEFYDLANALSQNDWDRLIGRAKDIGLLWPLAIALDALERIYPSVTPNKVMAELNTQLGFRFSRSFMAFMVNISLKGASNPVSYITGKFWLIRSQFTAMSMRHLLRHYWQKHVKRMHLK